MLSHDRELFGEVPSRLITVVRPFGETALHDPREMRRDRGIDRSQRLRFIPDDGREGVGRGSAAEARPPREHLVEE